MDQKAAPSLLPHEWLAVVFIIAGIALITFIGISNRSETLPSQLTLAAQTIEVTVTGAVALPGTHLLAKDANIATLLEMVKPLPSADLKKIPLSSNLRHRQRFHVPEIAYITVIVQGAVVKPGSCSVPKGTRRADLSAVVAMLPDADLSGLNSKRRLKEGEVLYIPALSVGKPFEDNSRGL